MRKEERFTTPPVDAKVEEGALIDKTTLFPQAEMGLLSGPSPIQSKKDYNILEHTRSNSLKVSRSLASPLLPTKP